MYVFQGAIGQKIVLNVEVDISAATTRRINYTKADGTTSYWTAAEESTTSISYTTTSASDLNVKGIWKLQAYIVTPVWTDYGDIVQMLVKPTL